MIELNNLDVIGGLLGRWFLPVLLPVILVVTGVTVWAYLASKGKVASKKYWIIPAVLLVAAVVMAIVFHRWEKVSY